MKGLVPCTLYPNRLLLDPMNTPCTLSHLLYAPCLVHYQDCLGLKFDTFAILEKSSSSSGLRVPGTTIFTLAKRSPGPSPFLGRPLPRNRNFCPLWLPGGILRLTVPSKVSTATVAPRAASQGARGTSIWRSCPSTRKRGCGSSLTLR